jgi:hypothetical protein
MLSAAIIAINVKSFFIVVYLRFKDRRNPVGFIVNRQDDFIICKFFIYLFCHNISKLDFHIIAHALSPA